jgi:hypothetical protein
VLENGVQLTNERLGASVRDAKPCEARDVVDIVDCDRH